MGRWRIATISGSGIIREYFVKEETVTYHDVVRYDNVVEAWRASRNNKIVGYFPTSQAARRLLEDVKP